MNCPNCGAAIKSGEKACENCGAAAGSVPTVDQILGSQDCYQQYYDTADQGYLPEDHPQMDYIPVTVPKNPSKKTGSGKSRRAKPHILLRFLLQLLSLLLSVVLTVCLMTTALLMDCSRVLSAGGMKQLISAFLSPRTSITTVQPVLGAVGANIRLDETSQTVTPEDIPTDAIASGDTSALVEWLVGALADATGEEVKIDEEQVQQFLDNSTISDYLAEKAAGYAEDFINNTQNTQITSEEVMELLEENIDLIETTFQVQITDEVKQELSVAVEQVIVDNDINTVIHEQVFTAMEETINQTGIELETIQAALRMLTSDAVQIGAIAMCVVLMLLLLVLNFYNIPGGLTWSAMSCLVSGAVLSLPLLVLQGSPTLLADLGVPAPVVQILLSFLSVFSVIHYGLLVIGAALLILSIIWRIIRGAHTAPAAY